jgi:hypothetical protein
MPRDRSEFGFWRSLTVRLFVIVLVGWFVIVWFQGCLVPLTQDEMRREQEKVLNPETPPR